MQRYALGYRIILFCAENEWLKSSSLAVHVSLEHLDVVILHYACKAFDGISFHWVGVTHIWDTVMAQIKIYDFVDGFFREWSATETKINRFVRASSGISDIRISRIDSRLYDNLSWVKPHTCRPSDSLMSSRERDESIYLFEKICWPRMKRHRCRQRRICVMIITYIASVVIYRINFVCSTKIAFLSISINISDVFLSLRHT